MKKILTRSVSIKHKKKIHNKEKQELTLKFSKSKTIISSQYSESFAFRARHISLTKPTAAMQTYNI